PVSSAEVERLLGLYDLGRKNKETFEMSMRLSLKAVLVSPHFLFRGELQPSPNDPQESRPIDEFSLASRLSYFLWSSMPDDELSKLAQLGKLRQNLSGQIRRMLNDPKSKELVENFGGQWLQLRNLAMMAPDKKQFPGFDDALRGDMERETIMFFDSIVREDRSVLDFLNADYTFVNERLAKHYGMPNVQGETFQKVSLKGTGRAGLLTHGSILTLTSNPTRTSPVKRGKWVLENLLGTPPPPPPPDVPELDAEGKALTGTLRQRLEQHRKNPACASCHARMDPIGFGLENFDGVGARREKDGGAPIDPAGNLVSGEEFKSSQELADILASKKRAEFIHCISEKMLTYALGRGMEFYDKCAVEQVGKNLMARDYKFSTLIIAVVQSTPFQMRRGEGQRVAQGGN
ncbi:MAG TPA: DUF1592 domain-containing protein, partial [Roseimicrobium sp.]|nr:DUF1592 domain-containing protein [Roseimicrobium sp.]